MELPTDALPLLCSVGVDTQKQTHVTSVFSSGVSRMGAGLTSMFTQAKQLQTTLQQNAAANGGTSIVNGGSARSQPSLRSSQEIDRDGQLLVEIFENERLEGKLQATDPKRFSDRNAAAGSGQDAMPEGSLPEGNDWLTDWEIDQNYTAVDRDGMRTGGLPTGPTGH